MKQDVLIAYCTCPDEATGERIAATLLDKRLAACINLLPGVRSYYRWEGRVENDREVLLLIKTTVACLDDLRAAISEHHPYDVPELIATRVEDGLPAYLDWVRKETPCG